MKALLIIAAGVLALSALARPARAESAGDVCNTIEDTVTRVKCRVDAVQVQLDARHAAEDAGDEQATAYRKRLKRIQDAINDGRERDNAAYEPTCFHTPSYDMEGHRRADYVTCW